MTYAFTSQANNNGSAFGGLTGNTNWFNIAGAICMLVGRFMLMIPVLAIAGSLGRKQPRRRRPERSRRTRRCSRRCSPASSSSSSA